MLRLPDSIIDCPDTIELAAFYPGAPERQVGPLACTSARKADSGTHGGRAGGGKLLRKI